MGGVEGECAKVGGASTRDVSQPLSNTPRWGGGWGRASARRPVRSILSIVLVEFIRLFKAY